MDVFELSSDVAESFIQQQPVSVILYFTPHDVGIAAILARFSEVAGGFHEQVGFGRVDLSKSENAEILGDGVVVLTPTVIYYRFGKPSGEDVGATDVLKWLSHDDIVHSYGHTDTRLRLIR